MTTPSSAPAHPRACDAQCPLTAAALGRRAFLSQSVLAAAAAALAACGGGGGDGATAPSTVGSSIRVGAYPALASTGGIALLTVNGAPLAVIRTGTSSFVALSRVCPHQGSIINTSTEGFLCPGHGARFDPTGTWIGGERTSNMRAYPTTFDATAGTLAIG